VISLHECRSLGQWPLLAILLSVMAGCGDGGDPDDPVVARAYGDKLLWSHMRQVIPLEVAPADSAALAQSYIQHWLRQQVILHKAGENLGTIERDIEAQIRDYRNSLVMFAYEQALVEQKLDTAVGDAELEAYYERNKDNFEMKDNILRVRWFKVREDDKRTMKRLQDHFLSGSDERMGEVEVWLAQRGIPITDRSASWTAYTDLRREIPLLQEDPDQPPLKDGRYMLREGPTAWFVDILEHRNRQSASPLELVRQDIRSIIINQRKLHLIERMREDLYREALEQKDIEVL
jgi:hypothetical protein